MKFCRTVLISVCFLSVFASPAFSTQPPEARIAAGPGNPSGLIMLSSWVVPDPNMNLVTAFTFSSTDNLKVLMHATTSKSKVWNWSVKVLDEAGTVVFSDDYNHNPVAGSGYFGSFVIGPLPQGFYLVKPLIKQGKKKVGMKYWIWVE